MVFSFYNIGITKRYSNIIPFLTNQAQELIQLWHLEDQEFCGIPQICTSFKDDLLLNFEL